ncbi:hypothetical protein GOO19_004633, partial [Salmonella enterica]|nr:hypothetical protein [Salmonella enterica]EDR5473736.1 hypothetical protein [Salmonella enterica subsp. enterica serovar Javiana]EDS6022921.1 hypothetical protein [Salmonella enterica subsp. enterica serovar Saintpaul]EDT8997495.1 hypothetical protein [Salmonella enterica subsp. enterica serovar Newport]EDV1643805.1 hypothetical protein [Salmonella enterica subsp. enterica serovar 6,7:-:1,5]
MSLHVVKKQPYSLIMLINSLLYIHDENEDALKMLKFVIYGDTVKNLNKT